MVPRTKLVPINLGAGISLDGIRNTPMSARVARRQDTKGGFGQNRRSDCTAPGLCLKPCDGLDVMLGTFAPQRSALGASRVSQKAYADDSQEASDLQNAGRRFEQVAAIPLREGQVHLRTDPSFDLASGLPSAARIR
jgi:hypothetical protein